MADGLTPDEERIVAQLGIRRDDFLQTRGALRGPAPARTAKEQADMDRYIVTNRAANARLQALHQAARPASSEQTYVALIDPIGLMPLYDD